MRFLLLLLPLALAACTPDLSPEAARDLAAEAEASGDARGALRAYKAAANSGDLEALNIVANAYRDGYVRAQTTELSDGATFLPILALPGQDGRWRARYERERDALALSGDPAAWVRVAEDLTVWKRDETQADRDSARAIRQRLADDGYGPELMRAAMRLRSEGDVESADALLARAEAPYDAQACVMRVMFSNAGPAPKDVDISAAGTARMIDGYEACPDLPGGAEKPSVRIVRNLTRFEPPPYEGHLDSLRALGVFERHPRLDQI